MTRKSLTVGGMVVVAMVSVVTTFQLLASPADVGIEVAVSPDVAIPDPCQSGYGAEDVAANAINAANQVAADAPLSDGQVVTIGTAAHDLSYLKAEQDSYAANSVRRFVQSSRFCSVASDQ